MSEPITPAKVSKFRIDGTDIIIRTQEVLTTVLISTPDKGEFIRVHPGPDMRLIALVMKGDRREYFLIDPAVFPEIKAKVPDIEKHTAVVMLRPYITAEARRIGLWPLKMESPTSIGGNSWNISAHNCARACETGWYRIASSFDGGIYTTHAPERAPAEPKWPDLSIEDMVDMAGRVNQVNSIDHPLIRRLRGLPPE
jgi:hypothetical protein